MKIIIYILILIIIYELIITFIRKLKRRQIFKLAQERSISTGKPLLVIGDPYNGLASIITGTDYDCGDLCIDLTGCPKCENKLKIKLEDFVLDYNLDDYIIYISCVLEYVDDIDLIVDKLNNLNPDNLFIVNVEYYSLVAYFYPYFLTNERPARNIILETKPIKYKKIY